MLGPRVGTHANDFPHGAGNLAELPGSRVGPVTGRLTAGQVVGRLPETFVTGVVVPKRLAQVSWRECLPTPWALRDKAGGAKSPGR